MSETEAGTPGSDIRPVVRTGSAGRYTPWLLGGGLLIGGVFLFEALDARRQAMIASTGRPAVETSGMIASPPPLSVPQDAYGTTSPLTGTLLQPPTAAMPRPFQPSPQVVTRVVERMVPAPTYAPPPTTPSQPVLINRSPAIIEGTALSERASTGATTGQNDRVAAGRLHNPALTVPQGTIISAVLETALDSTRPGAVRAIVSRDVKSFDGSRVLIPRGSRIYGEYASDLSPGQKRALVRWRRLTRPDAVIIDLDSPAADPLGRSGISGKVDTHFFERFGGTILQSALDVGVAAATQSIVDYPVIIALPGSVQQAGGQSERQVQATLKVRQGASVSVFVARDLDFSTVER